MEGKSSNIHDYLRQNVKIILRVAADDESETVFHSK